MYHTMSFFKANILLSWVYVNYYLIYIYIYTYIFINCNVKMICFGICIPIEINEGEVINGSASKCNEKHI